MDPFDKEGQRGGQGLRRRSRRSRRLCQPTKAALKPILQRSKEICCSLFMQSLIIIDNCERVCVTKTWAGRCGASNGQTTCAACQLGKHFIIYINLFYISFLQLCASFDKIEVPKNHITHTQCCMKARACMRATKTHSMWHKQSLVGAQLQLTSCAYVALLVSKDSGYISRMNDIKMISVKNTHCEFLRNTFMANNKFNA